MGNVRTPFIARWKATVDFLFVIIERFQYLLRLRHYKRKSVEVGVFRMGVTLSADFRRKRARQEDGRTDRQTDKITTPKTALA